MIAAELKAQIRHWFHAEHWKVGTIATQLGLHPDTRRPGPRRGALSQFAGAIVHDACQPGAATVSPPLK